MLMGVVDTEADSDVIAMNRERPKRVRSQTSRVGVGNTRLRVRKKSPVRPEIGVDVDEVLAVPDPNRDRRLQPD